MDFWWVNTQEPVYITITRIYLDVHSRAWQVNNKWFLYCPVQQCWMDCTAPIWPVCRVYPSLPVFHIQLKKRSTDIYIHLISITKLLLARQLAFERRKKITKNNLTLSLCFALGLKKNISESLSSQSQTHCLKHVNTGSFLIVWYKIYMYYFSKKYLFI